MFAEDDFDNVFLLKVQKVCTNLAAEDKTVKKTASAIGMLNLCKRTATKREATKPAKKFKRSKEEAENDIDLNTLMEHTPSYTPKGARTPDLMYRTSDSLRDGNALIPPTKPVHMQSSFCKYHQNLTL